MRCVLFVTPPISREFGSRIFHDKIEKDGDDDGGDDGR
jgi:hypothetical protein